MTAEANPLHTALAEIKRHAPKAIVTIGNFDGVHLGHQAILTEICALAKQINAPTVALTFEPHPVTFFGKSTPELFRLTSPDHKHDLLAALGVDRPAALPFTRTLASMTPESFVDEVLYKGLDAHQVRVGYDFNFGKNRSGTPEDLKRYALARGIEVIIHSAVAQGEQVISSTRIRRALKAGHLSDAAQLLGRLHALRGTIEPGDRRGASLGFPTANIAPSAGMMIPRGVYITTVRLLDKPGSDRLPAITNVGIKPTFKRENPIPGAETHILAEILPDADLYGERIEVELVGFIREEKHFEGVAQLKAQIAQDVAQARQAHGI